MDGADEKSHRGIVRLDWFRGLRCCHLLSLSVVASCLSAHSQNNPVHMSGLRCSPCFCACARPQKKKEKKEKEGECQCQAHWPSLSPAATTVLQAGILMSLLGFSDWNKENVTAKKKKKEKVGKEGRPKGKVGDKCEEAMRW